MITYRDEAGRVGLCARQADVPKHARIETVDEKECVGICEYCGQPILQGDEYEQDQDSIVWHKDVCVTIP